jgi:hypothetical protein
VHVEVVFFCISVPTLCFFFHFDTFPSVHDGVKTFWR